MTINLHSLFQGCDPRVLEVFKKLVKGCSPEKVEEIITKAKYLELAKNCSPERALADTLAFYKLAGAVP